MKRYESDDDLDRALFALDLEEPPADLRAKILAGTVYRAPVSVPQWEIWTIGSVAALAVWLLVLVARGSGAPALELIGSAALEALGLFSRLDVLFWTAVGASAAFWISQLNLTPAPGGSRAFRR